MKNQTLAERMKYYEAREAKARLMPGLPICLRLDGKRFSAFTRDLVRPYDGRMSQLMIDLTQWLVEQTQARIGYTQSDEITLVLYNPQPKSQTYLDGRIQKLASIVCSQLTAKFNALLPEYLPEKAGELAFFDCRVWSVPSLEEACNVLLWREIDATRNSINMGARALFSHAELLGKSDGEQQAMMLSKDLNWNDYPAFFKRGSYLQRHLTRRSFTADELARLPPKHAARRSPDLQVERAEVRRVEMPRFASVVNRVEVVFEEAAPRTAHAQP